MPGPRLQPSMLDSAWKRGVLDRREGSPVNDCPYSSEAGCSAWREGWYVANAMLQPDSPEVDYTLNLRGFQPGAYSFRGWLSTQTLTPNNLLIKIINLDCLDGVLVPAIAAFLNDIQTTATDYDLDIVFEQELDEELIMYLK